MDTRLQYALKSTYSKYGRRQVYYASKEMLLNNNFSGLTNNEREGLRDKVIAAVYANEISIEEEFLYAYINGVLSSRERRNALEEAVYQTYEKFKKEKDGMSVVYNCLRDYVKGNNHFTRNNMARSNLDRTLYRKEDVIKFILEKTLEPLIQEVERERTNPITNIQMHGRNMARVVEQKISGLTHDVEGSIALSGMNATINIGTIKENQEDAVLLKIHPKIPGFKILVVSDGVGGMERGEKASHNVVEKMSEWFGNLSDIYYYDIESLKNDLDRKIKEINTEVNRMYKGKAAATIVCAIVGNEKTLIANVGDSRAYGVNDGKLIQFTRDDSLAQELYDRRRIKQKDDMRFFRKSNMITQAIGATDFLIPNFYTVDNSQYNQLLLFSDGVTDCLSDSEILAITKRTSREELSKRIVRAALESKSQARSELINNPDYVSVIKGGKDNTTAAVYERE